MTYKDKASSASSPPCMMPHIILYISIIHTFLVYLAAAGRAHID